MGASGEMRIVDAELHLVDTFLGSLDRAPNSTLGGGVAGEAVAVSAFSLGFSIFIVAVLACGLGIQWRRCRRLLPMPWDIYRRVEYGQLRLVHPEPHPLDSSVLEVTVVEPGRLGDVASDGARLPLQELLEWVASHPFTGYKGGVARLVAKLMWLQRGDEVLESEIQGFNDIDLICFLSEGDSQKQDDMKRAVDAGLTIGGIPVEAPDVEYTYDTIQHAVATRDVTQNQVLLVSDDQGRVLLVNAKVCREHCLRGITAPCVSSSNVTLDEQGNLIATPKIIARTFLQWLKGRARSVELGEATHRYYRQQKLPKVTQFQIFSKCKGNDMYMRAYTELVRLGFLDRVPLPHLLWGECYAHMNGLIANHGYRLELEDELDSKAVEIWKEAKYAEQHARSRISIFRDFRWHRLLVDQMYITPYSLDLAGAARRFGLHSGGRDGHSGHRTREHLTFLREATQRGNTDGHIVVSPTSGRIRSPRSGGLSQQCPGHTFKAQWRDARGDVRHGAEETSRARVAHVLEMIRSRGSAHLEEEQPLEDDAQGAELSQTIFGKLTFLETLAQVTFLAKPAWPKFLAAFLLNGAASTLYVFILKRVIGLPWLLVAAALSVGGCLLFLRAVNQALLHALTSLYSALINMRLDSFTARLFPEFWARLTGDTKALQTVLHACNDLAVEILTVACAACAALLSSATSCDAANLLEMLTVTVATMSLMAALSLAAGLALRRRSRTVRSMMGFLYYHAFNALSRFFEIKAHPEEWSAAKEAFGAAQEGALEERRRMGVLEEVLALFLRYAELACVTLVLSAFVGTGGHASHPTGPCSRDAAVQAVAITVALSAMRRACERYLCLISSVGSLERFFLLASAALRATVPRFDGVTSLGEEGPCTLEIPEAFTLCVGGSAQFGPFARVPALPTIRPGRLHAMEMPRGSGATSLGKVLLRAVVAPARVKLGGLHVEQYGQETLAWAVHLVDHAPFPSSLAATPGQGCTLADYVQLGMDASRGLPLQDCLLAAGILQRALNIPNGVESTTFASVLTRPELYLLQLAQALFRASLGVVQVLVVVDPLRDCCAAELEPMRRTVAGALAPLADQLLVLVVEQTCDVSAWRGLGCRA